MATKKLKEPKVVMAGSREEAQIINQRLKTFSNDLAWKHIVKYYDQKIAFHKKELEEKKITSLDELERIRDKINLCEQFRNIPDILVGFDELATGGIPIEFDPYK